MIISTPFDQLTARARALKALMASLATHATITDLAYEERRRQSEARMWGEATGLYVIHSHPYRWNELSSEGQKIQQKLHEQFEHFREVVKVLIRRRIGSVHESFEESVRVVSQFVQQDVAGSSCVATELAAAEDEVDQVLGLLASVEDRSDRRPVFVPDTNALIYNTALNDWAFAEVPKFRLALMPTVLQELDQLKVTGRVEGLREKSERVIRQLKEYQRRGSLHLGVPMRVGRSELLALPLEPDMSQSLPWLRESAADDRLIASTLEVMQLFCHSPVSLVTRDINVQNKASYAGIAYVEPPEPGDGRRDKTDNRDGSNQRKAR